MEMKKKKLFCHVIITPEIHLTTVYKLIDMYLTTIEEKKPTVLVSFF